MMICDCCKATDGRDTRHVNLKGQEAAADVFKPIQVDLCRDCLEFAKGQWFMLLCALKNNRVLLLGAAPEKVKP